VAEPLGVELDVRAALTPAIAPAAILAGAGILLAAGPGLPPSLAGLKELGPYLALSLATAAALWINRGRAFVAAASLLVAYAGWRFALDYGPGSFTVRAVYTGVAVLVPANVLAALLLPERGVKHHYDYRWLGCSRCCWWRGSRPPARSRSPAPPGTGCWTTG
jgi:hypothetical protein